nr:energy transducer TonB [Kofleriaceae bacterium]
MQRAAWAILFLLGCERSEPALVASAPVAEPIAAVPAASPMPTAPAPVVPIVPMTVASAGSAGSLRSKARPSPSAGAQLDAEREREAEAMAALLTGPPGPPTSAGDISMRRATADLKAGEDTHVAGGKGSAGDGAGPLRPAITVAVADVALSASSTLTSDAVRAKLPAYVPALRRCYGDASSPPAASTVTLVFAISEAGRVTPQSVAGAAGSFGDCATHVIQSWRFPIAKTADGDAVAVTATVKLAFAVQAP